MPGSSLYLGRSSPVLAAFALASATVIIPRHMIPTVHVRPIGVPPSLRVALSMTYVFCTGEEAWWEAGSFVKPSIGRHFSSPLKWFRLEAACAGVPHSTEKTMSRGQFFWTMAMIRFQSRTPSPQAQPTGVPVTLPRSAAE